MKSFDSFDTKRWSQWLAGVALGMLIGFVAAKLFEQYRRRSTGRI